MSNLYPKYKEALLQAGVNLSSGTVKAALIDSGAEAYNAADQYYSDVTSVLGTPGTLASKTFTGGVFDAADTNIVGVTGSPGEAIILYVDTGTALTSPLIAYIDGLTFTPNGGDILISWNASGIFAL